MCKVNFIGYTTEEGTTVTIDSLKDIPEKVQKELEKSPASQLDILYIRNTLHSHGEVLGHIKTDLDNNAEAHKTLMKQLTVEVGNGGSKDRPLRDIVKEMYEREGGRRDRFRVKGIFRRHRKGIMGSLIVFLASVVVFKDFVYTILQWIGIYIIDLIQLII